MKANRVTLFLQLLPLLIICKPCASQEIRNDTIYVSNTQQTTLLFPSRITSSEYSEEAAYARFNKRVEEGKVVYLTAKAKNVAPAILNIEEGKRYHVFILIYKDQLSLGELEHDWSKLKSLKSHVAELALKPARTEEPPLASNTPVLKQEDTVKVQPQPAKPEIKEDYNKVLLDAYKLFDKKDYPASKKLFELAVSIKPDERIAHNKIDEIDAILNKRAREEALAKEIKQKEESYREKMSIADKAFAAKIFEEAEANYLAALAIKPKDPQAGKALAETKRKLAEVANKRKNEALEADYQKNIAAGKLALDANHLEDAKAAFSLAADMKPADAYASNQVAMVAKKIADREQKDKNDKLQREKKAAYEEAIARADGAFNSRDYIVAVEQYRKALTMQTDPYPAGRLKNIEELLADSAQKLSAERARLLKEKKVDDDYKLYIAKGDKLFEEKDYEGARKQYAGALSIKNNAYPKDQIAEIAKVQKKMAEDAELNKNYVVLVNKAKAALKSNDYDDARKYFEEVLIIKPTDEYAKNTLDMLYKKLEDIAAEKARDQKYNSLIADAAKSVSNMPAALALYKEANALKPAETLPVKMIAQLEKAIAKQAADLARAKRMQEEQQKIKSTNDLTNRANAAILDKNWDEAKSLYKELLSLNPSKTEQDFANRKIESIDLELARIAARAPVKKDTIVVAAKTKGRRKKQKEIVPATSVTQEQKKEVNAPAPVPELSNDLKQVHQQPTGDRQQKDAIVYTREMLTKKYPGINFDELPQGQTFDPAGRKNRSQYFQQSSSVATNKPSLNFYDSANNVKVTCQGIDFNNNVIYLTLLIENFNTADDFVAGAMQLKLAKKNGGYKDLNQLFISDFPVVMPGREFTVVYVTDASRAVSADDTLILELSDRVKNRKLNVKIPGDVYNQLKLLAKK